MKYNPSDLTRLFRTKITLCECGCWTFARTDRGGYSSFKLNGKNVVGHRYAYKKLVGEIPEGFDIDHLCDRHRNCVNPEHMEAVPKRVNALRANERKYNKPAGTYDLDSAPNPNLRNVSQPTNEGETNEHRT
jgi:hypothetical protein